MNLSTIPSDELCRLCTDSGHAEAWLELVRRYRKPIALTVLRVARVWGVADGSPIDDLVQETFLRLCADSCRVLREFTPLREVPDSLGAFVKVVASNVAHDFFRSRAAAKRGGAAAASVPELPDEELLSDLWTGAREVEREVQVREIERALGNAPASTVTDRDRVIFRLYFNQGLAASAIAAIPAVQLTTKGVESAIYRISRYLRMRLNPNSPRLQDQFDGNEGNMGQIPIKEGGA